MKFEFVASTWAEKPALVYILPVPMCLCIGQEYGYNDLHRNIIIKMKFYAENLSGRGRPQKVPCLKQLLQLYSVNREKLPGRETLL